MCIICEVRNSRSNQTSCKKYTVQYLYTLTLHGLLIAPFEKVLLGMLLKRIVRQPTRFRRRQCLNGLGWIGGDEDVAECSVAHDYC